jgi:hypothetical protein
MSVPTSVRQPRRAAAWMSGHPGAQHDIADQGAGREALRVEGQRIAGHHAERRRVDDEVISGGIVVAEHDAQTGVVPAQTRGERPGHAVADVVERD